MIRALCLLLLLGSGALAGCMDADGPPSTSTSSSTSAAPPPLTQLPPIRANEGDHVVYGYDGRNYNPAHRVDANLDFILKPGLAIAMAYAYPGHPAFDNTLEGTVSAEGGWNTTTFPCPHVLPDDRNTKCQTYRGGHGWETDLDGPFFGYALLAGLPVSEDGTLERMFRVGLRPLAVRFHAEDLGDTVAVTPQDPRARSIVLQDDAAFNAEAVPCGIFSGRIVVEKATGLPLSCEMVADRTTPAMAWTRTEHRQSDAGAWGFSTAALPDMAPPSGANRFPPRSVDDGLPFGFWDALDAAAGNADIKAMLARPSTWPARFGLSYRPVDTVPGVVRSAEWSWTVELQDGSSSLTFTVTKTGSMLRPYEVAIDGREVNRTLPTSFSVGAMPLGSIWSGSARLLGFSPIGLFCQSTPDDGRFVEFTGFAEALCSVTFARPPSEGPVSPKVSYRSDGSMLIFEANGAVADPYVES